MLGSKLASVLAMLVVSGPHAPPRVWNDVGHRVVACIAWEDLTPATRDKLIEILKQHPRYEQDLLQHLPEDADELATVRHAFATAATWPDMVRSNSNPMHAAHDHPVWHYINLPFVLEEQAVPPPPASDKPGPRDIVEALTKSIADLADKELGAAEKAVALCWLLHLAGDLHQPLHACSLFSPQFPDGDQGGNAQLVLRDPPHANSQMNLHHLWDSLPGTFKATELDACVAAGLRADPRLARKRMKDVLAEKDIAAWARASHDLAVKFAYLDGALKSVSTHAPKGESRPSTPGVPQGYVKNAERLAMERLALAGYRAADLLNGVFDPR